MHGQYIPKFLLPLDKCDTYIQYENGIKNARDVELAYLLENHNKKSFPKAKDQDYWCGVTFDLIPNSWIKESYPETDKVNKILNTLSQSSGIAPDLLVKVQNIAKG